MISSRDLCHLGVGSYDDIDEVVYEMVVHEDGHCVVLSSHGSSQSRIGVFDQCSPLVLEVTEASYTSISYVHNSVYLLSCDHTMDVLLIDRLRVLLLHRHRVDQVRGRMVLFDDTVYTCDRHNIYILT